MARWTTGSGMVGTRTGVAGRWKEFLVLNGMEIVPFEKRLSNHLRTVYTSVQKNMKQLNMFLQIVPVKKRLSNNLRTV